MTIPVYPLVLIADDHVIIRRGLKFLLDMHFSNVKVLETETTLGVMRILTQQPVTHLILDMQLEDGNIMEVFGKLRNDHPYVRILIYTMSQEEIFGRRLLQAGANGFLNKQSPEQEVIRALDLFFKGRKYVSQHLQDTLDQDQLRKGDGANPFLLLSDRETEVLIHLLKGETVKEIAARLSIKSNTVATFKARLFDKIGVSNLIDLQNMARMYHFQTG